MEKYTTWRDNGTGIAPFLPNTVRKPSSIATACSIVVLAVKAVVALPLILLYSFTKQNVLLGLILKLVFSWKEEVSVQGIKKRDVEKSKHYPQKGKLYICNCTSPLEALSAVLLAQGPVSLLVPSNDIVYKVSVKGFFDFILAGGLDIKLALRSRSRRPRPIEQHCKFHVRRGDLVQRQECFTLQHKWKKTKGVH